MNRFYFKNKKNPRKKCYEVYGADVFTGKKRCCHVYPSYIFNMIDELMEQRLKYIWNLFNKYLHIIEDVAWDGGQQRYVKSNVRS